jgi:uncharacterized membrane protein
MTSDPITNTRAKRFGDRQMETMMGHLLQVGVLLASAVVLIGGALYVHANPGHTPDYRTFQSEPQNLRHFRAVAHGVAAGDPASIIVLGVLLLIATPVARVAFALVAFSIERDKLYIAVSLIVLVVLMFSLLHPV